MDPQPGEFEVLVSTYKSYGNEFLSVHIMYFFNWIKNSILVL